MKKSWFTVEHTRQLTADTYEMVLSGDTSEITAPGQFVELELPGKFLRRPISICNWTDDALMLLVKVVGGGTKDRFLSQMTADACGVPVAAGPEEATAIGNLMMQAIAAGEVADLKQARQIVADSFELKHYTPSADRALWDEAYGRFCAIN